MIIGLGHKKRVGKDTVADYLVKQHKFVKLGFADPLKELVDGMVGKYSTEQKVANIINWLAKYDTGDVLDEVGTSLIELLGNPKSPMFKQEDGKYRVLLQYIGTDLIRATDSRFWISCMEARLKELAKHGHTNFVISDVRFSNEKDFIDWLPEGYTVKVHRDTGVSDAHSSETDLNNVIWDYHITNNRELYDLYLQIEDLIDFLTEDVE